MTDEKAKDAPIEFYVSGINFKEVNLETIHSCTGFITSYDAGKAETVYVIEYSAYRELEAKLAFTEEKLKQTQATVLETIKFRDEALAKLDIAVAALKYSSHQYSDGVYDLPLLALEALQELGEA